MVGLLRVDEMLVLLCQLLENFVLDEEPDLLLAELRYDKRGLIMICSGLLLGVVLVVGSLDVVNEVDHLQALFFFFDHQDSCWIVLNPLI